MTTLRFYFREQPPEAWALFAILRNQSDRFHKVLTPDADGMITAPIEGDDASRVNVMTATLPRSTLSAINHC